MKLFYFIAIVMTIFSFVMIIFSLSVIAYLVIEDMNSHVFENTGIAVAKGMVTTFKLGEVDNDGNIITDTEYIVVIRDSEGISYRFDNEKLYQECMHGEKITFKYKKGEIGNYLIEWSF